MARELHFNIFHDASGEYRWALVAANGRTIGDSGEGYATLSECRAAIKRVMASDEDTSVRILPDEPPAVEIVPLVPAAVVVASKASASGLTVGSEATCDTCGLRHIVTADGLCPNNNCPQHYRSYPEYRAATGRTIASLEAMMPPPADVP